MIILLIAGAVATLFSAGLAVITVDEGIRPSMLCAALLFGGLTYADYSYLTAVVPVDEIRSIVIEQPQLKECLLKASRHNDPILRFEANRCATKVPERIANRAVIADQVAALGN